MCRLNAFQERGARLARQERFQSGPKRFVADASQPIELVEELFTGFDEDLSLAGAEGDERVGGRAAEGASQAAITGQPTPWPIAR